MHELDTNQSITATVCEQAALFGAIPDRDEFDTREVWDPKRMPSPPLQRPSASWQGVWLRTEPSSPMSGRACSGGS